METLPPDFDHGGSRLSFMPTFAKFTSRYQARRQDQYAGENAVPRASGNLKPWRGEFS